MRSLAGGEGDTAEGAQEPDRRLRGHHGPVHPQHHAGAEEGTDDWTGRYEDDIKTVETIPSHPCLCGDSSLPGLPQGEKYEEEKLLDLTSLIR